MRASLALLVAAAVGASVPTHANPAIETQFFDAQARRAYERGQYREALDAFLLANDVAPSARSLYNVGICAELAGERAVAYAAYEQYLHGDDEDAQRRADAQARMRDLKAALALIQVESDPPGATIYVDRRELGDYGHAPRTIVVSPGIHAIELVLADHVSVTQQVTAAKGKTAKARVALAPHVGTLRVETVPAQGTVTVVRGRTEVAEIKPGVALSLPVGRYWVRARAAGHADAVTAVLIQQGRETAVELVARPLPVPTGRLLIDTGSVRAKVFIDGKPAALTPATLPAVPVGRHRLKLWAKGYRPWTATVLVKRNDATYVNATLLRRER